ncbi:MAG: methyltransferase domain-containing protein [Pseudomonadota bacterium]
MTGDLQDRLAEAYERGLAAEKAGDRATAAEAYAACLALDPDDCGGVAVRLAALGLGPAPERAPPAYVATLFDQHAESFEMTLVHSLGYAIPEAIAARLAALGLGPFQRGLDLGCGTGLVAEAMEGQVGAWDGVDLAEEMLAIADEKELYAGLYAGDAVAFLEQAAPARYDLVVAADVLPYLGALEGFVASAARALTPGGVIALSTETDGAEPGGPGWGVGAHQRFGHDPAYLTALMTRAGIAVSVVAPETIRYETGRPVPGHLVIGAKAF